MREKILLCTRTGRKDGGLYKCTASNGVGQPVSKAIQLNVLCKYALVYI